MQTSRSTFAVYFKIVRIAVLWKKFNPKRNKNDSWISRRHFVSYNFYAWKFTQNLQIQLLSSTQNRKDSKLLELHVFKKNSRLSNCKCKRDSADYFYTWEPSKSMKSSHFILFKRKIITDKNTSNPFLNPLTN